MVQKARPVSDSSVGKWVVTPLFDKIDEATPSDADFVSSDQPKYDTFIVKLANLNQPQSGAHTLTARMRKNGTADMEIEFALLQGTTTVVAKKTVSPTESFVNYTLTLTQPQIDAITDYRNLYLRITASTPGICAVFDTFNVPNTVLTIHAPDVCTASCVWVFPLTMGTLHIVSNQATNLDNSVAGNYIDSGLSDVEITADITTGDGDDGPDEAEQWAGMLLRVTNGNNLWYARMYRGEEGDPQELRIIQRSGSTDTLRASKATVVAALTTYNDCKATACAQVITFYNGTDTVTYSSASFNESATKHGLNAKSKNNNSLFDNFEVCPCP